VGPGQDISTKVLPSQRQSLYEGGLL
jgi:hypothetical protein